MSQPSQSAMATSLTEVLIVLAIVAVTVLAFLFVPVVHTNGVAVARELSLWVRVSASFVINLFP